MQINKSNTQRMDTLANLNSLALEGQASTDDGAVAEGP